MGSQVDPVRGVSTATPWDLTPRSRRNRLDLPNAGVAVARETFLRDEPLRRGTVRQPIVASWTRSRALGIRTDHIDLGTESDEGRMSLLARIAEPILDRITDTLATEPMSVILCDDEGVVLDRRTGDSTLEQYLDKVWLAPGFSYSESNVGTNGIGTTVESGGPAHVFGHEHWVEHLAELACAGAPIRHPVTGKVVGVLDLTGWRRNAGGLMVITAAMIAARVTEGLLAQAGRHELALLNDYLTACHRNRGIVLAVSEDLLMLNDRARSLLDPSDQAPVVAAGTEALRTGRRAQQTLHLPSGAVVRLHSRPSFTEHGRSGGILLVQFLDQEGELYRATTRLPLAPLPTAVGTGALWAISRQSVDRHFTSREWLILTGEAGSGMRTLARATHQARTPAAHIRVLDADDYGPDWLDDVAAEFEQGGGTLILAHLDRLPPSAMSALTELLEPYRESTSAERLWVVGTARIGSARPELVGLTQCFPRTVEVPPLRHHLEDVPELVRHFLTRLSRGGDLSCSPAAMRMLMRHHWPGNVAQLHQVIRKVVSYRRTGVIEVGDLPSEIWTTARRVLTPLEAIECDAIVKALLETGGNKSEAAQHLGMSRATIYRKIREYGISVP